MTRPTPEPVVYRIGIPSADRYHSLFETTGWNATYGLSPGQLDLANMHSWHAVSAYLGDRLVGFGRVVSDGVLHAMIYDMIVDPEYQRQSIGSQILAMLVARCRDAGIRDVQLFCARGKKGFYLRHGFVERPADAPGMQLDRRAWHTATNQGGDAD